jgi:DNA replication protein DnaC
VKTVKDLKEYVPVMIEDDQGNESEDLSKRPADLIIDEDGLWQPIEHEYKFGVPCPYCGQVNKYLLRFKQSGLTADAIGKHVDNFNFDSEPGLREKAMSFVKGDIRGGLLYGQPGNGKTHLLCAIAREFIWNNKKVRYVSHQSILEQIRQSFDKGSNIIDPRYSWLDGLDVVLFDELGFFRKNDWSKQTTNELIHALHAANVQVIFASNLTPKQLKVCKDFKHEMIGKDQRASEDFWV